MVKFAILGIWIIVSISYVVSARWAFRQSQKGRDNLRFFIWFLPLCGLVAFSFAIIQSFLTGPDLIFGYVLCIVWALGHLVCFGKYVTSKY